MASKTAGKLELWLVDLADKIADTWNTYIRENFIAIDNEFDNLDTTKISKTDIADNLTTDNLNKVLSAKQGKNLKDDLDTHLADIARLDFGIHNAGFHNSIYRGKYLGNSVSPEQWAEIEAGTFRDMYIGDYWTIDSIDWVICAFDYYMTTGSSYKVTVHHVVIMPRTVLYTHKMNATNTTEGGYLGSLIYEEGLDAAKATIKAAFNNRILKHEQYLTNGYGEDGITASVWVDSEVELCNEVMVFGTQAYGSHIYSSGRAVGIRKSQLPIFQLRPDFANLGVNWWLSDPASASYFASVRSYGLANSNSASFALGVRPLSSIS